jgi:hypothetical protein
LMRNGKSSSLTLPGRHPLIKPVSDVDLRGLNLSRKLKAACITDGSGTPKGIIILEDLRTAWIANDVDELKRLHDALETMIAALERPLGL